MGSILNGLALTRPLIPYGGTFLIFSDIRPPIRLAAMMGLQTIYVYSHDSIGLGEDGPTHQPIEQLAGLRSVPNLTVIRPADARERGCMEGRNREPSRPYGACFYSPKLPIFGRTRFAPAEGLEKKGHILTAIRRAGRSMQFLSPRVQGLAGRGLRRSWPRRGIAARVVSMPSWELFERRLPSTGSLFSRTASTAGRH
jgi:transketolase